MSMSLSAIHSEYSLNVFKSSTAIHSNTDANPFVLPTRPIFETGLFRMGHGRRWLLSFVIAGEIDGLLRPGFDGCTLELIEMT